MKRETKRKLAGIALALAICAGMMPNMPALAENGAGTEEESTAAYDAAVFAYWEQEGVFWTKVDAYYGNEENGTEGALQKYYKALEEGNDDEAELTALYNAAVEAYRDVVLQYGIVDTYHYQVETEYEKLTDATKADNEESYNDIEDNYENGIVQCRMELEEPADLYLSLYWNAESAYWDAVDAYWKKMETYYGNEETGITGALEKYNTAREAEKDVTEVLKNYEAALAVRSAVVTSYEDLAEKYELAQEKYQAISDEKKGEIENHDDLEAAYADAKQEYDNLDTPEALSISEKPTVQTSEKAPKTTLDAKTAELLEKINLTDEEKNNICGGASTNITLKVEDKEPADNEKNLIQEKLGDYTIGQYLNIEMLLKVGNVSRKVTDITQPVSISITIPDSLINKDTTEKRTYSIIRIHDGAAEVIKGAYDASNGTFTFETDKFSVYTLIYKDEKVSDPTPTPTLDPAPNPLPIPTPTPDPAPTPNPSASSAATATNTAGQQSPKTGDYTPLMELELLLLAAAVTVGIMGKRVLRFRKRL